MWKDALPFFKPSAAAWVFRFLSERQGAIRTPFCMQLGSVCSSVSRRKADAHKRGSQARSSVEPSPWGDRSALGKGNEGRQCRIRPIREHVPGSVPPGEGRTKPPASQRRLHNFRELMIVEPPVQLFGRTSPPNSVLPNGVVYPAKPPCKAGKYSHHLRGYAMSFP